MSKRTVSWGRRRILKLAGISAAGVTAASGMGTVGAQSVNASPIENQEIEDSAVDVVDEDPDDGFHSPYFLFTPETPESADVSVNIFQQRPLLVQNHPWGDFEERVEGARGSIQGGLMRSVADAMNCPLLVAPLRFRADGSKFGLRPETELTDPREERVDLQLLAMIEDAKSRLDGEPYTVADQIHFQGASSAGTFIDLFAALHPEHVEVFSSGANGFAFLPFEELTDDIPIHGDPEGTTVLWPVGTGEFEELVGREFNRGAWMEIEQFQWIGAEDQDPEDPDNYIHKFKRGSGEIDNLVQEIFGTLQVDHRFETAQEIYDHLGVPATFTAFEGAGHAPGSEHMRDVVEYHQQKIAENYEMIRLAVQEFPDEISLVDAVTVPVLAENPTPATSTTTVTLAVDGTEVDATEIEVNPNSTETVELEATFEEAGEYALSVNDSQFESSLTVIEADAASDEDGTESTADPEPEQEEASVEDQPGFGIGQTIAALGGIGYLLKRRLSNNE